MRTGRTRTDANPLYEDHFGLAERPFGETVAAEAYVPLPSRDAVLRRLRYGLEHGQGPALLFGPPGAGKTLAARRLALDLAVPPIHMPFPAMPAGDFIVMLAEELGVHFSAPPPLSAAIRQLRDRLSETAATGLRPLVIVDEAHLIRDPSIFETLRLLLNFATAGPPDLSLLLVGTAELVLNLPPSLADRLTARCLLGPLSETESSIYLHGRLAAAGASQPHFTPDALAALHRAADGVPRRLNHLADLSLLIAYAEGDDQADARTVNIARREFEQDPLAA